MGNIKNYKPTDEEIEKWIKDLDNYFEENKEFFIGMFREFEKRGD